MMWWFWLFLLLTTKPYDYVPSVDEYVSPHEYEPELLHITGYINPHGNPTANGSKTFVGSCASNKKNLGKVVALYDKDKNFIGYYDINDTGGTKALKTGKAIDIYFEDEQTLIEFFEKYGTKLYVQIIESEG